MNRHEPEAPAVAELRAVTVRFGRVTALRQLSLTVPAGGVYALLGRNGSGKSTAVRVLLGQLRPDRGEAVLLGVDPWRRRHHAMPRVGVVPETPDAPPEATPRQLGRFVGRLYGRWNPGHYVSRLERFGVPIDSRFRELSKGERRHVSLALALAAEPEVLILDDPTLGLDPVARAFLFDEVVGELADRGISVLITTHDLAGVEGVADTIGMIRAGELLVEEDVEQLKTRCKRLLWSPDRAPGQAPVIDAMQVIRRRRLGVREEAIVAGASLESLAAVESAGVTVEALPLEEIFLALCGQPNGGLS